MSMIDRPAMNRRDSIKMGVAAASTRRDRYDANGLDGKGFHPFFTKDGKLRAGLEFLQEPPAIQPPWKSKDTVS